MTRHFQPKQIRVVVVVLVCLWLGATVQINAAGTKKSSKNKKPSSTRINKPEPRPSTQPERNQPRKSDLRRSLGKQSELSSLSESALRRISPESITRRYRVLQQPWATNARVSSPRPTLRHDGRVVAGAAISDSGRPTILRLTEQGEYRSAAAQISKDPARLASEYAEDRDRRLTEIDEELAAGEYASSIDNVLAAMEVHPDNQDLSRRLEVATEAFDVQANARDPSVLASSLLSSDSGDALSPKALGNAIAGAGESILLVDKRISAVLEVEGQYVVRSGDGKVIAPTKVKDAGKGESLDKDPALFELDDWSNVQPARMEIQIDCSSAPDKRPLVRVLPRGPPSDRSSWQSMVLSVDDDSDVQIRVEPGSGVVSLRPEDLPPETLASPERLLGLAVSLRDGISRAVADQRDLPAQLLSIDLHVKYADYSQARTQIDQSIKRYGALPELTLRSGLLELRRDRLDVAAAELSRNRTLEGLGTFYDEVDARLQSSLTSSTERNCLAVAARSAAIRDISLSGDDDISVTVNAVGNSLETEVASGRPITTETATPTDLQTTSRLYVDDSLGLNNRDWSPASRAKTIQAALETGNCELRKVYDPGVELTSNSERVEAKIDGRQVRLNRSHNIDYRHWRRSRIRYHDRRYCERLAGDPTAVDCVKDCWDQEYFVLVEKADD